MFQVGIFNVPTCFHCLVQCAPSRRVWLLLCTLCQVPLDSNKIYPHLSLHKVEPCLSASLHPSCVPEHDLRGGCLLDFLQYVSNFLVMGRPKPDRIFQIKMCFMCYNVDKIYFGFFNYLIETSYTLKILFLNGLMKNFSQEAPV